MTHVPTDLDAWRALRRAVGDARLLGSVFLVVGALFLIPMLMRQGGVIEQLLSASASLILLAPGILYWIAASALHHRKPAGAVLARRAAAAHILTVVGSIALGFVAPAEALRYALFGPGVVALFFVPALLAFLAQTRTALRAAQKLDDTGRAFEPLVARPILPVDSPLDDRPPT